MTSRSVCEPGNLAIADHVVVSVCLSLYVFSQFAFALFVAVFSAKCIYFRDGTRTFAVNCREVSVVWKAAKW